MVTLKNLDYITYLPFFEIGRISTFWSRESWVLVPAEPRGVWPWASHLISLGLSFLRSITKIPFRDVPRCSGASVPHGNETAQRYKAYTYRSSTRAEWVRKVQHPALHIDIGKIAEFWKFSFPFFFFFFPWDQYLSCLKRKCRQVIKTKFWLYKRLFLGSIPTYSLQMPWLSHSASLFTLFLASTSQFSFCTLSREAHLSNTSSNAPPFS